MDRDIRDLELESIWGRGTRRGRHEAMFRQVMAK